PSTPSASSFFWNWGRNSSIFVAAFMFSRSRHTTKEMPANDIANMGRAKYQSWVTNVQNALIDAIQDEDCDRESLSSLFTRAPHPSPEKSARVFSRKRDAALAQFLPSAGGDENLADALDQGVLGIDQRQRPRRKHPQ